MVMAMDGCVRMGMQAEAEAARLAAETERLALEKAQQVRNARPPPTHTDTHT
jgi:hypothetical protein